MINKSDFSLIYMGILGNFSFLLGFYFMYYYLLFVLFRLPYTKTSKLWKMTGIYIVLNCIIYMYICMCVWIEVNCFDTCRKMKGKRKSLNFLTIYRCYTQCSFFLLKNTLTRSREFRIKKCSLKFRLTSRGRRNNYRLLFSLKKGFENERNSLFYLDLILFSTFLFCGRSL